MTRDEMFAHVLESLVNDGIFVRTGKLDENGQPTYKLAPELEALDTRGIQSLIAAAGKGAANG